MEQTSCLGGQYAKRALLSVVVLMTLFSSATQADLAVTKAYVEPELFYYPEGGTDEQEHGTFSLASSVELYSHLGEYWTFKANPYARVDAVDSHRNLVDLKELDFEYFNDGHIVNLGIRRVSWSTVEAVNVLPLQIADVINQRDIAGDPAGQEKLGAPSVRYAFQRESLQFELYYLPWFRERTLPSRESRENFTRGLVKLDEDDASFTDDDDNRRPAVAARVEWITDAANFALLHYNGYRLDPLFVPAAPARLRPLYYLVNTTAFTVQASVGSWLYKAELAYSDTDGNDSRYATPNSFWAGVGGAEYTLIRPEAQADLSLFAEYIFDTRKDGPLGTPFDEDLFFGVRWASNDHNDSTLIIGAVTDLSSTSTVYHLNFKRRLASSLSLDLTLRGYDPDDGDPLYAFRQDHLLNVSLFYYFR